MKPFLITALLCFIGIGASFAQKTYSVKGAVEDTASKLKMANAVITVVNAKDSILQKFTRVKADGSFNISNLQKGKYIFIASYPGYADYVEHFMVDSIAKDHDFGLVNMVPQVTALKEVIIRAQIQAMKVSGDSTIFDAKAFKIEPNDKVEDLLKKFAGVQIDQHGKITFQGKEYKNVTLDGEEFFGDDPTLVTKNIRADMIDKAQFFDKKSDAAKFSGIDDGVRTPTLNLTTKADKKKGYFGKVQSSFAPSKYYNEQVMYNNFDNKRKFSAYGNLSNTGQVGLSGSDSRTYGDPSDYSSGSFNGIGIPVSQSGGVHFDDKWNKDKQSINLNYKINHISVNGISSSEQKQAIDSVTSLFTNVNTTGISHSLSQKVNGNYQQTIDTTSNFRITFDGSENHGDQKTTNLTAIKYQDSTVSNPYLQNNTDSRFFNTNDQKSTNVSAYYQKKFKNRSTIYASVRGSYTQSNNTSFNNSLTQFYAKTDSVNAVRKDTIDQRKINNSENATFSGGIAYNKPVSKTLIASISYGVGIDNSTAEKRSLDRNGPKSLIPGKADEYTIQIDSLSNDFKVRRMTNSAGAYLNYKKSKLSMNIGSGMSFVNFKQIDEFKTSDNVFTQNYINWSPSASAFYSGQGKFFYFYYSGNQTQPTVDQLQPVKDNNPTYRRVGNPDLDPSFTHRFNMSYSSAKLLSQQSLGFNANYSITTNQIIDSSRTDSGRTTSTSVNLAGHQPISFGLGVNYSMQVNFFGKTQISFYGSVNGNTYYSYQSLQGATTPSQLNKTSAYTYKPSINIYKSGKIFDSGLGFAPSYTVSVTSLKNGLNNSGHGFDGNWWVNFKLPANFGIGSWGTYMFTGKTEAFNTNYTQTIANAYINKKFFKKQDLKLSIFALDIFDQDKGFSRSNTGTAFSQTQSTKIGRLFTLDLSWDFNVMGGSNTKK